MIFQNIYALGKMCWGTDSILNIHEYSFWDCLHWALIPCVYGGLFLEKYHRFPKLERYIKFGYYSNKVYLSPSISTLTGFLSDKTNLRKVLQSTYLVMFPILGHLSFYYLNGLFLNYLGRGLFEGIIQKLIGIRGGEGAWSLQSPS